MIKSIILAAGASLATLALAPAAQVLITNFENPYPMADIGGNRIANGQGFVAIGVVDTGAFSDDDIRALSPAAGASGLDAAFTQFGSAITFNNADFDGFFEADISQAINDGDPLIGQTIYLIAGDGADILSSEGLIVIKSNTAFEADGGTPFETSIRLDGVLNDGGELLAGTPTSLDIPGVGSFDGVVAAPVVPEPSVGVLAALAGLALVARRRR